jgi:thioredoxin reductase
MTARATERFDAIIVGGGPAGLSGAIMLGRCRRKVLVLDSGRGRNRHAHAIHGYLTHEGITPKELLRMGREQLRPYAVTWRKAEVTQVERDEDGFTVRTLDGRAFHGRRVLLATGLVDHVPELPGMAPCFGKSVFHCPYCDGWDVRDKPIAVLSRSKNGPGLAVLMQQWSADVILFTDGARPHTPEVSAQLAADGIRVVRTPVQALLHHRGMLRAIRTADGTQHPRAALFLQTGYHQHAELVTHLGCRLYRTGTVITDRRQRTGVSGLYVAGDAAIGTHLVSVAAAEGAKAAIAINDELVEEDRLRRRAANGDR